MDNKKLFKMIKLSNTNITEHLTDIAKYIKKLEKERDEAFEKMKEWSKEEEIQKLKKELDYINEKSVAIFENTEEKDYKEFKKLHWETCKGNTEIIIGGSSIGHIIKCRCTKCGEEKDITDVSCW